ncbi:integrin beta-like protein 1 [Acanthopagrus latus]|uniref:integrin beta-like protein 1 n=1 Tax=Acanthopagrus latus TaxID=8177 RepID=UPI00187BEC77|nr:integrin beta-like protein 1 [Acanthopagrus latus]
MHTEVLVQSMLVPLFLILLSAVEDTLLQSVSQVGGVCKLSTESSLRRCRTPDGKICSGRGKCDCGICLCQATDPGKFFGPRCECHDWVCETYNGNTCNDRGFCDCGTCECDEGWSGDACQFQEECNLPNKKSKELCKNPQGVVCSNRGTCHCGSCMCDNEDNRGLVTGRFCECDDSECLDEDTGEVCGGHGQCYCGNCYCAAGWHGDRCEFLCDISPWESKKRCTSPDGKICSNRGTCVCGECNCYDVDPSGDWGDIHGDTCECDERNCHATYDRYTDDFCSGHGQCNCGRCDCKEGWAGKKCEHPLSCSLSLESSVKKCRGTSNLPCFGRGQCLCGQCTCHPPGDSRVHGKNCECDDRQCEDINGEVCGGHGYCSCGRCICEEGWFGKLCQFPRSCDMSDAQSKELCETSDGVMCSGKGSCHCGQCICSPQDWWVSGEHCECDDRDCDKHDGLICTGNGLCNCGNCECWDGWTGNACEIWVGEEY